MKAIYNRTTKSFKYRGINKKLPKLDSTYCQFHKEFSKCNRKAVSRYRDIPLCNQHLQEERQLHEEFDYSKQSFEN